LVRWTYRNYLDSRVDDKKVLDLGCGQGSSTMFLSQEGFDVSSIDFSQSAVEKCASRLRLYKYEANKCVVGNISALPWVDKHFDAVVDIISSAHNTKPDIEKIYAEVARVLKPRGKLFAILPTNTCSRRPFMKYGTVSFMEKNEVEDLLSKDFTKIEILSASYEIETGCEVRNWIVTADRRAA
jgi:ubiquinone/menaquinone biosynthesis C-methylase UbiE